MNDQKADSAIRMTGGTAVVHALIDQGVDTVFGLPGVQLDHLFNAFHDSRNRIRMIHTRHEQGAAYMAYGYARSTGRPGVCVVVPGPGVLNAGAALSTAYATNTPVLCLAGQISSTLIGRGFGELHEIPDQIGTLRGLTKWAARIARPSAAPGMIAEAFRRMGEGRPRPVGLEVAPDILAGEEAVATPPALDALAPPPIDADAIEAAARILGAAQRPLIIAGSGAMDAGEALIAVAEALQAPIGVTRSGCGCVSDRHGLVHTLPAAHRLWPMADAVLAVGTRFQAQQRVWGLDDALKVVRIDVDPDEIDRVARPTVAIAADAGRALTALHAALLRHNRTRPSRKVEMTELKAEMTAWFDTLRPQSEFLHVIREELPDDGIFVDELTQVSYPARFCFPVYRPRSFITPGYQGTLGYGFATALGAKVGNPDRQVISVSGDGGFMFNVQELATAVQHDVRVVAIVFADGAFGNVRRMQKHLHGGRVLGTELRNPDFVALAKAFGANGLRATTPEELRQAIRHGFAYSGPTLIEVPIGEMPEPWKFIQLPRARPAP